MYTLRLFSLLIIKVVYVTSVIRPLPSWIQIDDRTCLRGQKASIRNAFSQMVDIAEVAYDRMDAIPDGSRPNTVVVIHTFMTYFAFANRENIPERVEKITGYLNDIKNLASNPISTITISCDDSYLTKSISDENGNPLPDGQYQVVDKRFFPWIWFPIGVLGCGNVDVSAYSNVGLNYIVLCPLAFAIYPTLSRVGADKDISVKGRDTFIDQVRPLGTALFHEFLHHIHFNSMDFGSSEVYGFRECKRLSSVNTPAPASMKMPDCIALFAFSLYLEGNDWSTGKPRAL